MTNYAYPLNESPGQLSFSSLKGHQSYRMKGKRIRREKKLERGREKEMIMILDVGDPSLLPELVARVNADEDREMEHESR
jgi:hypothetical protein